MNNKTEAFNEDDYLDKYYLYKDKIIPESCRKLKGIESNIMDDNNIKHLVASCSEHGSEGYYQYQLFMRRFSVFDDKKIKLIYDKFKSLVNEDDIRDSLCIYDELKIARHCNEMADRGFFYKGGKTIFDPNTFSNHFLRRVDLIALNDDEMAIYNRHGYYTRVNIESLILAKLAHKIMNEPKELWNSFNEKEGLRAVQRATKLVKNLTTNRNLVNLKNGMFNLTTYELKEHSP